MFKFFSFLRVVISVISVVLAVFVELKKATDQHFAGGITA